MPDERPIVVITGAGGFIGRALTNRLGGSYNLIGLDRYVPEERLSSIHFETIDLTANTVNDIIHNIKNQYGNRLASVIHLAAYFDLTSEPNSKHEEITARGTERLLLALQDFTVEQFVLRCCSPMRSSGRNVTIVVS